jgi:hypothetical protein
MQDFEEGNIERFQAATRRALNGRGQAPVEWGESVDSGNRDVITVLRSGERDDRPCRLLHHKRVANVDKLAGNQVLQYRLGAFMNEGRCD